LALVAADASGGLLHDQSALAGSPYSDAARVIRAAERGNVRAQAQLGFMYSIGQGVPQDYVLAAKWYRIAAERGHGGAQFALGLLHNKGQGVQMDFVRAYMWLNLSASQAVGEDRDFKVRIRDAVASKMTVAEVAVAQQMAMNWYVRPQ
jgi:TPR repeat protein